MKLWQVKWFKLIVIIASGLLAVGITFVIIFIQQNSKSESPTPPQNFETPLPSLQGHLPEPETLGVATKDESDTPILMYHHIQDVPQTANSAQKNLSLSPEEFKGELKYLSDSGYRTATLAELFNDMPEKRVVLTFDDGYKDVIDNALPALKEFGFRGVVFIIVNEVGNPGYLTWGDIEKLSEEGWEIGSHSLTHPDLKIASDDTAKKQIVESKRILEEKLNISVEFFSYPAGKYNDSTISILNSAGYTGAVTVDYGAKNYQSNIFKLKRIRLDGGDSHSVFKNIFK